MALSMAHAESETRPALPWRIGFCITDLDPGGAERALVELATRIDRGRFEPVVYCLGPRGVGNARLVDRLEDAGIAVHCFGARRVTALGRVLARLRRQLIADRVELLQTFMFHANVLGAVAARMAGVKHVVTGIRVAEHRARWHLGMARWADRYVERHVCVSQSVRDFSIARGYLPADKLLVIPNGVDVARFAAAQPAAAGDLGLAANRRMIVAIGRLDAQKGLGWLLESMVPVFAERPEHDLVLVGDGRERANLEALAERLGIATRVRFAGFRDEVPEILAASELVVLASRWEGMPNVVLEAMAAGRPVVATDVEGVAEVLGRDGGQVVASDDPRAFAEKVAEILGDRQRQERLGRENQARASEQFGLPAMVDAYQRLYAALLAGAV
jgi:glycosyltransferase involved in cell wall biosynthesis